MGGFTSHALLMPKQDLSMAYIHRLNNNNERKGQGEIRKIGNYTAQLTILWYDLFDNNHTPLQKNGMAAIPKTVKL